jgi:LmbE family N-acetylglucosaminyl deacetylase
MSADGWPWSAVTSVLAVVAHPDDESFGLGAVLDFLSRNGSAVGVICFTHGEASTLGVELLDGADLHAARAAELTDAARELGIDHVQLHDLPDGRLSTVPVLDLARLVEHAASGVAADLLLVFDQGGITGHPDHIQATEAALVAGQRVDLPVLAWAVPRLVAVQLNTEFGTAFEGRPDSQIDHWVPVDRTRQLAAIARHRTQSSANPVLWRRLDLTGHNEAVRLLRGVLPGRLPSAHAGYTSGTETETPP